MPCAAKRYTEQTEDGRQQMAEGSTVLCVAAEQSIQKFIDFFSPSVEFLIQVESVDQSCPKATEAKQSALLDCN